MELVEFVEFNDIVEEKVEVREVGVVRVIEELEVVVPVEAKAGIRRKKKMR